MHIAAWGKYGGLFGYKLGIQPNDSPECVRLLLEAGADREIRDDRGRTAIIIAAQTGGKRSIPILLQHGADINAVAANGQTAILSCFYYGLVSTAKALLYYQPSSDTTYRMIDVSSRKVCYRSADFVKKEAVIEPLEASFIRDHSKILKFVIEDEQKLISLGYKSITVGPHNFERLLAYAVENRAFKCTVVLVEHFQQKLRLHKELDLVSVLAHGMTEHETPVFIIVKLYECIRPTEGETPLSPSQVRQLIEAFCATKLALIDEAVAES